MSGGRRRDPPERLGSGIGPRLVGGGDAFLEDLFEERGVGDTAWRRALSRESDEKFRVIALASRGAVLVSFWHLDGMAADSGTPTEWLSEWPGVVVNVHCDCDPPSRRFSRVVRPSRSRARLMWGRGLRWTPLASRR
jgi:hypothetical protein